MSEPASVVMSAGTVAVLRVLAGAEQEFTVRELGRLAGVSRSRVSQVVDGLSSHGVVATRVKGRSHLCSLNREHIMTPPLIAMTRLRHAAIDRLREMIESWGQLPAHASVFGSVARGDGDVDSDIDALVIRPADVDAGDEDWSVQLYDTARRMYRSTGNELAWFDISESEFHAAVHADDAIVHAWRRESIHLAGERLRVLMRKNP